MVGLGLVVSVELLYLGDFISEGGYVVMYVILC